MAGLFAELVAFVGFVSQVHLVASAVQHGGAKMSLRANVATGHDSAGSFVRSINFKHRFRICNAFPFNSALDVFSASEKLTGNEPLKYKACREFDSELQSGDKLEFKVGDTSAGTFAASDLPSNDAVLLLVVHRHDAVSTAMAFTSHIFANLVNAQVAVIDTYKGSAVGMPKIEDLVTGTNGTERREDLRYNSVVAVNPGQYRVVLDGEDGKERARSNLVAVNRENYVVMRTGVEAKDGETFPEELVVFPQSSPEELARSAALQGPTVSFAVMGLIMIMAFLA